IGADDKVELVAAVFLTHQFQGVCRIRGPLLAQRRIIDFEVAIIDDRQTDHRGAVGGRRVRRSMRRIGDGHEKDAVERLARKHAFGDEQMGVVDWVERAAENTELHKNLNSAAPTRTVSPGLTPSRSTLRRAPLRASARWKNARASSD